MVSATHDQWSQHAQVTAIAGCRLDSSVTIILVIMSCHQEYIHVLLVSWKSKEKNLFFNEVQSLLMHMHFLQNVFTFHTYLCQFLHTD